MNSQFSSLNSSSYTIDRVSEFSISPDGPTPFDRLVDIIHRGPKYEFGRLIQQVDINQRDRNGYPPLVLAIKKERWPMVEMLLQSGADANASEEKNQDTALHHAVAKNHMPTVQRLLDKEASVNAINNLGCTPLHVAVTFALGDLAGVLLERGASLEVRDSEGATPLLLAAMLGEPDMVNLLLAKGADASVRFPKGSTVLHAAVEGGHDKVITALLSSGRMDVGAMRQDGATCLTLASGLNSLSALTVLLENGVSPNQRDGQGRTALMSATSSEAVAILLRHGADVSLTTPTGDTALHAAAYHGRNGVLRALVDAGALINAQESLLGDTPLHVAALRHPSSVRLLKELGANDRILNRSNQSAQEVEERIQKMGLTRFLGRKKHQDGRGTLRTESRPSAWLATPTVPLIVAAEHLPGWAHGPRIVRPAGPWSRDLVLPARIDILDAQGQQQRYMVMEGPAVEATGDNPEGKTRVLLAMREGG